MSQWYLFFLLNHQIDSAKIDLHLSNKRELAKQRANLDLKIPMNNNYTFEGQMYDWLAVRSGVKFVFHTKIGMTISVQIKFPAIITK